MSLSLDDIQKAAARITPSLVHTPCMHSRTLSARLGTELFLKFENLQFTASFKERGALHKLLALTPEERRCGVIAVSAGNHAQAVAYHAHRLGIPATIVMPRTTPNVKVENTGAFGAEIMLYGRDLEQAMAHAMQIQRERGLVLVHPYEDPDVVAGQGSVALEILEDVPDLDVLVVPIGGGGLIAGCATAAKGLRPGIEIVGVQAAAYATVRATREGAPVKGGRTIAEGIAVKAPGPLALSIIERLVDDVVCVDERALEESVRLLLEIEKTVVEGAGAAALAAVLSHGPRFAGRRVAVILSGGNIDPLVLSSILYRGLVRSGRLARLCVELDDSPGALADVTRCLADADVNIIEVHHQRSFTHAPLRTAEVEFVVQTRGLPHMQELLRTLQATGYTAHWLDPEGQRS